MVGIVLAGGRGTRLNPLTQVVNKHVLPIWKRPMLFYPIDILVNSGVMNIIVVNGPPFGEQIKELLKSYDNKAVNFSFVEQPSPLGMPDAILKCEGMCGNESIVMVPGDNVFSKTFKNELADFEKGAIAHLIEVDDPSRFGVPEYEGEKLMRIVEKPKMSQTNKAVIAPYIFDNKVFELIQGLKPSARGELEIVDLLNIYMKNGGLNLKNYEGFWRDVGTFEALFEASQFLKENQTSLHF